MLRPPPSGAWALNRLIGMGLARVLRRIVQGGRSTNWYTEVCGNQGEVCAMMHISQGRC